MPILPSKWTYEDDVLAPNAKIVINYNGPNPFRVYGQTMSIVRNILEVGSEEVWERDFRWDTLADPRPFFVRTYVNFGMDARTKMMVEVVYQGTQPSDPTKNGKLTITINARLKTEFDLSGFFRSMPFYWGMLWLYHKIFYFEVRRGYLNIGKEKLQQVASAYRKLLGIPPVPLPESRTTW